MCDFHSFINDCLLWREQRPSAIFKQIPADFVVNEILDWAFRGEGEHLFLQIEKTNANTVWVAKQLAKFYQVPPRDVGYSGLKDRYAVTTQYFSVRLPGIKPGQYELPQNDEFHVISHVLHDKKLKRGYHRYNDFCIRLRGVDDSVATINHVETTLSAIRQRGCPNLFDRQRFGHHEDNLKRLVQWINGEIALRKRQDKNFVLSALRASVFNEQLATRVQSQTWDKIIEGDVLILDGSQSHFCVESVDEAIQARAAEHDLHPAGILVGEDSEFSQQTPRLNTLMRREHLRPAYRPLRLSVKQLSYQRQEDGYVIQMRLPRGAYASGVIKQIFAIE